MADNPTHGNDFVSVKYFNNIVFVQINKDTPTTEEIEETKNILRAYYELLDSNDTMFGMIFNIVKLGVPSTEVCIDWAEFMDSIKEVTVRRVVATAIISENVILNGVLNTFLYTMYKVVKPVKLTDNIDVAVEFINEHR